MRLRLRGPAGASMINLADNGATIADLLSEITKATTITNFDIKYGYPPKPLLLNQYEKTKQLKDLDVK